MKTALAARDIAMDCKVTLSETGGYVLVRPGVPMTIEPGRECGAAAVALSAQHHLNKFLFDLRNSPNIEEVASNYEFARNDMHEFGFPEDSYSALLVHPEDHSHDFIAIAFKNAGYNVGIFDDEEMAVRWLEIKGA